MIRLNLELINSPRIIQLNVTIIELVGPSELCLPQMKVAYTDTHLFNGFRLVNSKRTSQAAAHYSPKQRTVQPNILHSQQLTANVPTT